MFRFTEKLHGLKLSISDDFSPEERAKRRSLLSWFPQLKEMGFQPKIRGDLILIGDQLATGEEVKNYLASVNVSSQDITTKEKSAVPESASTLPAPQQPPLAPRPEQSLSHSSGLPTAASPQWPSLPHTNPTKQPLSFAPPKVTNSGKKNKAALVGTQQIKKFFTPANDLQLNFSQEKDGV